MRGSVSKSLFVFLTLKCQQLKCLQQIDSKLLLLLATPLLLGQECRQVQYPNDPSGHHLFQRNKLYHILINLEPLKVVPLQFQIEVK